MRKIVIISVVFAIMVGLGIWEICYTTRIFNRLEDELQQVKQSIHASGDNIDNAETLSLMDEVNKTWKKGRNILFCLGNHNVLRTLDEKITSLDMMIKINYVDDAKVMVFVTINLVDALNNDTHPVWTNLF